MTEFGNQDSGLDDLPELDDLSFGDSDDGGMEFGLDDDGPGLEPLDLEGIDLGMDEGGDDAFELGQPGDELSGDFDLDLPEDSDTSARESAHAPSFEDAFDEGGFDETPSMRDDLGFDDFSSADDDLAGDSLDLDLSADDDVPEIAAIGLPAADDADGDDEIATGTSFFDETDDETVALSEDELQDILGNTDEAFFEDFGGDGDATDPYIDVSDDAGRDDALDNEDGRMELSAVRSGDELVPEPDLEPIRPVDADNALAPDEELGFDDFGSADDDFGDSDADVTPFSDEELELALSSPEDSDDADDFGGDSAIPGFLQDGDDDEPIALSEDELDSIMGDVEPAETEPGHHLSDDLSEMSGDDFDDLGRDDFSGASDDFAGDEELDLTTSGEEDENITLSDDELSQVLLDADSDEAPDDDFSDASHDTFGDDMLDEELPSAPSLSSLDMDDDEPIALTAEELGNIVSEVEGDEVVESAGFEPDADDFDFMAPDAGDDDSPPGADDFAPDLAGFENTEEEGPVALSDSELGSILEDTDSEALTVSGQTPPDDFDMAPDGEPSGDEFADGNVIVLDEYEDDASRDDGLPVVEGPPEIEAPTEDVSSAVAGAGLASRAEAIAEGTNLDRDELRKMIHYLDGLFDALPEDTVRQFSQSSYFDLYKKIMSELGL